MPDQILIGDFPGGLTTNRLPFAIDNAAFPYLYNFYIWRGRAKRKRGTFFLGRLQFQVQSAAVPLPWQYGSIGTDDGSGNFTGNLLVFLGVAPDTNTITNITQATNAVVTIASEAFAIGQIVSITGVGGMTQINGGYYTIVAKATNSITLNVNSTAFSAYASGGLAYLASGPSIAPGTLVLTDSINVFTDTAMNGTIVGVPGGTGTINYATGALTITGGAANAALLGTFAYFPSLPVMGLEDFLKPVPMATPTSQYPLLLSFDTQYAYQIQQTTTQVYFYNVSYYKYTNNPVIWSGQDYQQFWSTNYQNAFWATNNKPGFHFKPLVNVTGVSVTQVSATQVTITIATPSNLVVNDLLFFNEVTGTIGTGTGSTQNQNINGQTGYVSAITVASPNDTITVNFDGTKGSTLANFQSAATGAVGIAQYLTNSIPGQDGIKWYDGDPTGATGLPITTEFGWSNFAPPLTATNVSIDDEVLAHYYLVGALAIVAFKDRLLFFGAYIQTSGQTTPIQLQDVVVWSWNGTPYYANVPAVGNETSDPTAYFVDETGKGGWQAAGISQPIVSICNNEDVLLVGFTSRQTRFTYTSNDLQPFLFYSINSELGASSTFSGIVLDRGAITVGSYGIALTDQTSTRRIDLQIPDQIFEIQDASSGVQRVNSVRDFQKEWIYFSYPPSNSSWRFPTQTLLYNYRDNTWAIFYENFTAHGSYRKQTGYTWATLPYRSWNEWVEPWNSGSTIALYPSIVGGTPQGYVLQKGQGTGEGQSGSIEAISNNLGNTQITSYNHCVAVGDYLYFNDCIGNTVLNMKIQQVIQIVDENNFVIDIPYVGGGYLGLGDFARLSQPSLQTKQFNPYWEAGRQVRIGVQKYLLDRTANSQITLQIFLSQDPNNAFNSGSIVPTEVPDPPTNNSLVYSDTLFTCPEQSADCLQSPTAINQFQIWHRMNTSLQGDTFQIGLTLSDAQMRVLEYATAEITLHSMHFMASQGPLLA